MRDARAIGFQQRDSIAHGPRYSAPWSTERSVPPQGKVKATEERDTLEQTEPAHAQRPLDVRTARPNSRVGSLSVIGPRPCVVDSRSAHSPWGCCSHVAVTTQTLSLALHSQRWARVRSFVRCRRPGGATSKKIAMLPGKVLQPWEVVGLDLMSLSIKLLAKNGHLLLVGDKASRLPFAFPSPSK